MRGSDLLLSGIMGRVSWSSVVIVGYSGRLCSRNSSRDVYRFWHIIPFELDPVLEVKDADTDAMERRTSRPADGGSAGQEIWCVL